MLPLFVLDPALLESAGQARRKWLIAALSALDRDLRDSGGPGLSVIRGKPTAVIPRLANRHHAKRVHISADFGPYGRSRDERVAQLLGEDDIELIRTGSPYAVAPGTLKNRSGEPFQVFSPFHRAWLAHGVPDPAPGVRASSVEWLRDKTSGQLEDPDEDLLPLVGEKAARKAWRTWLRRNPTGWVNTPSCAISLASTPRRISPSPCAGATSIRAPCCTTSGTTGRKGRPPLRVRSHGEISSPTCCFTGRMR